jgi:hypothetical protein
LFLFSRIFLRYTSKYSKLAPSEALRSVTPGQQTAKKEELLVEIERQRELGDAGLLEEDKYLAEVKMEEMATSSGERHHYWLLAIQTAENHYALRAQRESQQMAKSDTTGEEGR